MSDHEYDYESSDSSIFDEDGNTQTIPSSINQYPLKYTWVLYDHTKSDSDTYEASTRKICEFNSVVKFWQIFNNYPKPSLLFNNGNYRPTIKISGENKEISSISVFKKGIFPKWEDKININGAEVSKRKFNKKDPLDELDQNWFDILIACIGGMVDLGITGIRVVDSSAHKKNEFNGNVDFKLLYRIELWFDNVSKRHLIEEQFKNILNIDDVKSIYYKEHKI